MKKFFSLILCLFCLIGFTGCDIKNDNIIRIHIRANSNSDNDQNIKLQVRDDVVEFITPLISDCLNSTQVKTILSENLSSIEEVANDTLLKLGCSYLSSASINNEFFPTRNYDGISFPADYYDALIIKLGSGSGDNWWCVAYPPLCFVSDSNSSEVEYKSVLLEMLKNLFG